MIYLFVLLASFPLVANAEPPINRLIGVALQHGTTTMVGYAVLSDARRIEPGGSLPLDELFEDGGIEFVQDIVEVKHPLKDLVSTSPVVRIPRTRVGSIRPRALKHDGYEWYGVMNALSPAIARDLQGPPVAQCEESPDYCKTETCYGGKYWLSYSKDFPIDVLKALCVGPLAGRIGQTEGLKESRVYRFERSGD